jgi:hypothetical protein
LFNFSSLFLIKLFENLSGKTKAGILLWQATNEVLSIDVYHRDLCDVYGLFDVNKNNELTNWRTDWTNWLNWLWIVNCEASWFVFTCILALIWCWTHPQKFCQTIGQLLAAQKFEKRRFRPQTGLWTSFLMVRMFNWKFTNTLQS